MPGIELDEDGSLDGSNDLTIRGRLLSLVEKVTYLKKKQAEKPIASDSRKPCKHLKGPWSGTQPQYLFFLRMNITLTRRH